MALLSTNGDGELCLRLAGGSENAVLNTLRRWPHWQGVVVERSPQDASVVSVTLATDPANEGALRSILKHGFGMTFPVEGGQSEGMRPAEVIEVRRGRRGRAGA